MTPLALNGGEPVRVEPYRWPVYGERERDLLLEVLESGRWSFDGPMELGLARRLASILGVDHAFLVTSGTVALELALEALALEPGDEVLVPAMTWTAPARGVVINGLVPVFVDIGPADWCIDPAAIEASLTDRTRAILVVHTYSHMADMTAIMDIAARRDLYVVEDCAHALGSEWNGEPAGSLGHIGCFSFQQSKSMTAGEGGLVVTSDHAIADRLYGLKNCGRKWTANSDWGFGGNHRITEFQAAVLLAQLDRLNDQITTKAQHLDAFSKRVDAIPGCTLHPPDPRLTKRNFIALPLAIDVREFGHMNTGLLITALAAEGMPMFLPHQVIYHSPLWLAGRRRFPSRRQLGLDASCPVAESVSSTSGVTIAHEVFLSPWPDIEQVIEAVQKVRRLAHTISPDARDTRRI